MSAMRADVVIVERGSALLTVLLIMFLFTAIAFGASVVVRTETAVAGRFEEDAQGLYAADAALALAIGELRTIATWTPVLSGLRTSVLSQGGFAGVRNVAGGVVSLCCGAGSAADRWAAESRLSPLPARRNVPWRPFLWAPLQAIAPQTPPSRFFILVAIQDDEEDGDGDTGADRNEMVVVRAEAVGPGGLRRGVEALVARQAVPPPGAGQPQPFAPPPPAPAVRIVRWRELR
jgi:hypothetical protein